MEDDGRLTISNFTRIYFNNIHRGHLTKDTDTQQWTAFLGDDTIGPTTSRRELLDAVNNYLTN